MAQVPSFDLDAALAGSDRHVGSVDWVSAHPINIESMAALDIDPAMAIIVAPGHGLKKGDRVFLGELGFMIDAFYKVFDHPLEEARANAFAVEAPEELGDRRLTNGKLHRPKTFKVHHPDHLPLEGATEMKKLGMDHLSNVQAQQKYQGILEEVGMANIAVNELAIALKIKPDQGKQFRTQLELLARVKDDELRVMSLDALKKKFHITQKKHEPEIEKVCKRLAELNETFSIDVENFVDSFDRQALELKKREIEILCQMPHGLMSALDNLGSITSVVEAVHGYVCTVVASANAGNKSSDVGNEAPMPIAA